MSDTSTFKDLDTWESSLNLALKIYHTTENYPREERFGLVSQLRRAANSIGANVAEGYGYYHYKNKLRFYYQARGSIKEVEHFLYISYNLEYLSLKELRDILDLSLQTEKLLNGLIRYVKSKTVNND
jgi:four helix bundle protein